MKSAALKIDMKNVVFFLIALFSFQNALAINTSEESRVIRINGIITGNTLRQVQQDIGKWKNPDPIPGGLIVLLNSPGGNGEVAMQIGRILRHHHAQAFVIGQCESACVFILAGGVVRAATDRSIGVHAGRLTITSRNGAVLKEIDASQTLENSFKLTSFNSEANQYFSEMGIKNGLIDVMLAHQTKKTYKLTEFEMQQFGIIGFDNQYLQNRGNLFETLPKPNRINRIELYNRTLSVPKLCASKSSINNSFVQCYKAVLLGQITP